MSGNIILSNGSGCPIQTIRWNTAARFQHCVAWSLYNTLYVFNIGDLSLFYALCFDFTTHRFAIRVHDTQHLWKSLSMQERIKVTKEHFFITGSGGIWKRRFRCLANSFRLYLINKSYQCLQESVKFNNVCVFDPKVGLLSRDWPYGVAT